MNYLLCYLAAVNLLAVWVTVLDKRRAVKNGMGAQKRRVPESTLLLIAALGGSVSMYAAMRAVHHKTRRKKFMIGIPAIFLLECAAIFAVTALT